MKIEEARAIYRQGEEATVKFIMDLDARYQKLTAIVEKLEQKVAMLEKNSRTSSKPPSSCDITKKILIPFINKHFYDDMLIINRIKSITFNKRITKAKFIIHFNNNILPEVI